MRRIARPILLPLAVGLLMTMLFAWPVSLIWPNAAPPWSRGTRDFISEPNLVVPRIEYPIRVMCVRKRRLFVEHANLVAYALYGGSRFDPPPSWAAMVSPMDRINKVHTIAHGWPMRALASETLNEPPRQSYRHAWVIAPLSKDPILVPLRPLWPGLVSNTAIFALVYTLIALSLSRARRAHRRRKNLCPHCRYDLRATPPTSPCPECGRVR